MAVAAQISRKEGIRGPNLAVFITLANGVPMEEALRRADEAGLIIASNKRLSQALVGSDEWQNIRAGLACWTGTMTGYVQAGRAFRQETERISSIDNWHFIVHADPETKIRYLFPVKEEHLDKTDCILAVNHPGFELVTDGRDRIIRAAQVDLIERFPAVSGKWYLGDPKYDIPTGDKVDDSTQDARYLSRIDKRVGPAARGYYVDFRRFVLANRVSNVLGVVVEAI
ncbi:hypothetical protein H0O00_03180 [Candidatus Micrarchaeota archaeon]|nr:hypothetical protein [Candidatus Micrarchaeota archaeon]